MKKFKFRLQTLLEQRQSIEDHLLTELGDLRQEEAREQQSLEDMQGKLAETWETLATMKRPDAQTLECFDHFAQTLRDDIKVQKLTIEGVQARVEAKRVELTEAMKQRKVIEALRDKQERAYIDAAQRAEQSTLDEMSSLRFARGM